jgi:hypothetical protein
VGEIIFYGLLIDNVVEPLLIVDQWSDILDVQKCQIGYLEVFDRSNLLYLKLIVSYMVLTLAHHIFLDWVTRIITIMAIILRCTVTDGIIEALVDLKVEIFTFMRTTHSSWFDMLAFIHNHYLFWSIHRALLGIWWWLINEV